MSNSGVASVYAQEVTFESALRTRITYDDNVVLGRDGSQIKSFFHRTTPSMKLSAKAETWTASLAVDASFKRYEDDGFDSDDQSLTLSLSKIGEKTIWQLQATDRRSNTLDTELEDLGEISFETNRREVQNLRPVVQYTFNPKNQLVFGLSAENTHYDGLLFRDYDYYGADLGWNHQWDEKTRIEFGLFANDFASVSPTEIRPVSPVCAIGQPGVPFFINQTNDRFDSETVGATLGARRQASNRLSYNASFGYRQVDSVSSGPLCFPIPFSDGMTRTIENSSDSNGLVLAGGFDFVGEKYQVSLAVSRSVSPVGLGLLSEQDSAVLTGTYTIKPTLKATLSARWQDSEAVDDPSLFSRRSVRLNPRLQWRYTEQLTLESGARFRDTKGLEDISRDGTQWYVGATYNFKPRKKTF